MDRWIGKVAVLTGGSTTIGLAVSQALVEKGLEVFTENEFLLILLFFVLAFKSIYIYFFKNCT